jgi:hypothetical protein
MNSDVLDPHLHDFKNPSRLKPGSCSRNCTQTAISIVSLQWDRQPSKCYSRGPSSTKDGAKVSSGSVTPVSILRCMEVRRHADGKSLAKYHSISR